MIGKITKGQRFYGLLRYLATNPNARQIDSTVSPASREAAAELTAVARGQRALANPVRHLMVRLPEAESLPDAEWRYVASVVLERLGYGDAPFVVVLHDDPAGAHIHIVTTARDFAGRYVPDSNDHHRIQTVLRELERELGLAVPQPREARLPNAEGPFRSVEAALDGNRVATAERVRDCAAKAASFDAFSAALAEVGLTVRAHWSRTGALRGLSFASPSGETFKASDLDRALGRRPLWVDFPALHRRGPASSLPAVAEPPAAGKPAASPPAEAPEACLIAALNQALARSANYPELVRHLESAGWTPQIVNHRFAYGIRFEQLGGPAGRPYRIAGSRLGAGYGLLALSRRFPHLFAHALPAAREVPFSPHLARHLVAFEVPRAACSRMKLDPRFVAFTKGHFFAHQKNARALEKRYGLVPLAALPAVRPRANPFGFAGFRAVSADREAYQLARLRGLADRVLGAHAPESREARRLLERLDRFAQRVAPDSPSLALQILVQLPSCPVRSFRPEAGPAADPVALAGPAAERLRLGQTGLVLAAHSGVVWIDRAHLPQVQHQFSALWTLDRLAAPAIDPRPLPSSSPEAGAGVALPRHGGALERIAAQDPGRIPAPWLLYVRALREPAADLAERSAAQALAAFRRGDRSSANLLALASRPARLRSPRSSRELGTYLRAERVLTARLLRLARSPAPEPANAAALAADLLAVREAVNTHLRRQAGCRQPPSPRPRTIEPSSPSPAEALRSINTFTLHSLGHLARAAGYWTALHAEDPALAVGRLAMTGLPPFRHAARFSSAVQGHDPVLSIARLYLVDGAIRAATVLAPQPLAAVLTTARALVSTLKTVLSVGQEKGRGR